MSFLPNRKRKLTPNFLEGSVGASKSTPTKDDNIKTFVFMKCNVTNPTRPRVIELAMIAVNKVDICIQGDQYNGSGDEIPRYKDTLVLAFDPTMPTTLADGNNTIEIVGCRKKPFDENAVNAIKSFLKKQSRPICLVAHNCVDFKFLKTEINWLNMAIWEFDNDELLCVDAKPILHAMVALSKKSRPGNVLANGSSSEPRSCQQGSSDMSPIPEFENIYQRLFQRPPTLDTAKNFATCLLEIFKSGYSNLQRTLPYQTFSEYPSLQLAASPQSSRDELVSTSSVLLPTLVPDETQTYVFLDLETTGLNSSANGIAELCMVAVNTRHLTTIENANQNLQEIREECSLMIHPQMEFLYNASRINGLTREGFDIRGIPSFKDGAAKILKSFLERQRKPICFVAHNGDRFDFRILKRHLTNFEITDQIWNNIHCADTLAGLRKVVKRKSYSLSNVYNDIVGQHVPLGATLHTAEGDVLRLIAITRRLPALPQWLDENKRVFIPNN